MKLQRMDNPIAFAEQEYEAAIAKIEDPADTVETEPIPWVEGEDYSRTITLSTGVVVTFRDMTGADLKFVEGLNGGNIDRTLRLAARLCVKWGDRDGVTPVQLDKGRAKDIMLISRVIESFLE